jgi:predicted amidohydrolase
VKTLTTLLAEPLQHLVYRFQCFSQRTKRGNHCPFRKRMAGVYHNSAYIIDTDGSEAGLYRKMHIPDDPHFYEKFYFTPGDLGFKTIPYTKGKLEHLFVGINGILKQLD